MLNGLQVLQIETNQPAKSKTTTKVPVPFVVVGGRHRKSPRRACARRGLCRLMASAAGDYSPSKLLVMEAAAFLPAPIARMTVAAPVTMSPPAQMRGSVVWPVSSSATM